MAKNKYLIYGIALIFIGIIFVVGYIQRSSGQSRELSVSYHYTTERIYYDAQIEGSKIIFTHADYEKIRERCAQWPQQSPCWTQQDLITEESQLTRQEIIDLKNFIEEIKIMQLENYYGPKQEARCYPYTIKINEKEIVYCSGPGAPSKPEAFIKVVDKIQEIVAQKFSR